MITILIVEDHPMFREGLRATLDLYPDITVVDTCATAAAAVTAAARHRPDIVVMDLQLPDGSGVTAARLIREHNPGCRVLVLTSHTDDDTVTAAVQAGALGFLTKDAAGEAIAEAVRMVSRGDGAFTGAVVGSLARRLTAGDGTHSAVFPQLSAREREVLALLATGHSNAYIADHFVLSLKTIRNHVSNILTKLGAATRAEAVVMARRAGLHADAGQQQPPAAERH
jgi:DNA-binding NarL/FixJ family response regulator